jgi:predicted CoA-substrate-specific enzyme activase
MSTSIPLQCGIDVGSTTVKAVVMDPDGSLMWQRYRRHNTRQPETVREYLVEIEAEFPDTPIDLFITGSGGRSIAPAIHARYIQEVNAVTYAVETLYPRAGSAIELGGQDAKVIIWKDDGHGGKTTLTSMNDKCAGGTGATIDKIFGKIGLPMEQAARVTAEGKSIHHIAAKCGVFAETDVVGLVKAGIDPEEIFVSLCNAIVKQNLEVLVRGNVLRHDVLLLGGPHTFLPVFTEIWRRVLPETWKLHRWTPDDRPIEEMIFVPPNSEYFAAMGAVLFGRKTEELGHEIENSNTDDPEQRYAGVEELDTYIHEGRLTQLSSSGAVRDGLVKDEAELEAFTAKYTIPEFSNALKGTGDILRCYLGIDGGSTSSKIVLINEDSEPVYKGYVLSKGNPIVDVRRMVAELCEWRDTQAIDLQILGSAVTGYASDILQKAFNVDLSVVETVAHMRSAVHRYGDIDIICDVGGQDIKVLFMRHGRVVDFKLNTQCSAGNGYFLQGMAEQFDIPVEEYAEYAFRARQAPAFNYGCAVFMEQDKVNFQQLGWSKEEIMAGLALVLPLNIWNYVVQESNIAKFGNRVVLQGGTQKNLAAVKAQVDYIESRIPDAEVHVHRYADICGAIGAAMEAKAKVERNGTSPSSFIGVDAAANVEFTARSDESTRCRFCGNRCPRTFVDITMPGGEMIRYISGNGCERGMSDNAEKMREEQTRRRRLKERTPNLVELAAREVFRPQAPEPVPVDGTPMPLFDPSGRRRNPLLSAIRPRRFRGASQETRRRRSEMVVGIPKLLNLYYYAPFFDAYFRSLGVRDVVSSDYTTSALWNAGNKWGANDPCFPAKVAPAHVFDLLKKTDVTHICFPRITHLESVVRNVSGNNACVIQMGTPEVVHAVFTKDRDIFADNRVEYWKPIVNMERRSEAKDMLLEYFAERMGLTEEENDWAVKRGFEALEAYMSNLREEGRRLLNTLVAEDRIGILLIGHPYHHDPGLNHGILEEFQLKGFPVLCIESLPIDEEYLESIYAADVEAEGADAPFDIGDVWKRNFNRNLNLKLWAAKFASRHPNIAVIDLSSFKCGFDAPAYSYIDNILDATGTPHFLFHDIDQNKPGATFTIRIKTIEYFLKLEEQRIRAHVKELTL